MSDYVYLPQAYELHVVGVVIFRHAAGGVSHVQGVPADRVIGWRVSGTDEGTGAVPITADRGVVASEPSWPGGGLVEFYYFASAQQARDYLKKQLAEWQEEGYGPHPTG